MDCSNKVFHRIPSVAPSPSHAYSIMSPPLYTVSIFTSPVALQFLAVLAQVQLLWVYFESVLDIDSRIIVVIEEFYNSFFL